MKKKYGLAVLCSLVCLVMANSMTVGANPALKPGGPGEVDINAQRCSVKFRATFIGRFDYSAPEGPKFSWSASTIRSNFIGTGIAIKLKRFNSWHLNYINVIIDNLDPVRVTVDHDGTYSLKSNLLKRPHQIEIVKLDEGMSGDLQFLGFEVANGELLTPPVPKARRIEIIGDSISCGYGIDTDDPNAAWDSKLNNPYLAYGALTARALKAECTDISWSGSGIYRTWDLDYVNIMANQYWRTLSKDATNLWNFKAPQPDVVVINLCTNDFSQGIPDKTAFTGSYRNFLAKLREKYPTAYIYCTSSLFFNGEKLDACRDYIRDTVVAARVKAGDRKIAYFEFSENNPQLNGWGGGYHPSVKQHQVMARELTAQIKKDLHW